MRRVVAACEVFEGLGGDAMDRIASIASRRTLESGETLFGLGDDADQMFVVLAGRIDLCVPIDVLGETRNVSVESKGPGSVIGWSAFVKPYRFQMSARAAEDCEVAAFARSDLSEVFRNSGRAKFHFMQRIAEITAARLLRVQALWVREFQRAVTGDVRETADAR